jgi:hypothetical protein
MNRVAANLPARHSSSSGEITTDLSIGQVDSLITSR